MTGIDYSVKPILRIFLTSSYQMKLNFSPSLREEPLSNALLLPLMTSTTNTLRLNCLLRLLLLSVCTPTLKLISELLSAMNYSLFSLSFSLRVVVLLLVPLLSLISPENSLKECSLKLKLKLSVFPLMKSTPSWLTTPADLTRMSIYRNVSLSTPFQVRLSLILRTQNLHSRES